MKRLALITAMFFMIAVPLSMLSCGNHTNDKEWRAYRLQTGTIVVVQVNPGYTKGDTILLNTNFKCVLLTPVPANLSASN